VQALWFALIAVLWAGFFLLEGFDFGVGLLLPAVARTDADRKVALRSIGPFWDGNEVWLVVAGGATFAAFPEWYASVFSGFYLAFALLLVGLMLRGIGIEYRGKAESARGRRWCDIAVVGGSGAAALLLGVAFADFLRGVQMNAAHDVTGGFFDLLTPYALLGGLTTLTLFALHGACFLVLRTEGDVALRAQRLTRVLAPLAGLLALAFVAWTSQVRGGAVSLVLGAALVVALLVAAGRGEHPARAFACTSTAAALVPVWVFAALYPDVLPARNGAALSLTLSNASSSHYTLVVMTVVAAIFLPLVLAYTAWTYWVFRARVTGDSVVGDGYGGLAHVVSSAAESARGVLGGYSDEPPVRT